MAIRVNNHYKVSPRSAPACLADVQQERLQGLRNRVSSYVQSLHLSKPVRVDVSRSLEPDDQIFYASAYRFAAIHLQNHWLIQRTDIPETDDPAKLQQWFSAFMGIPLQRIDYSFYKQVVKPVVALVRSPHFEKIRDYVLLHELGHIVHDAAHAKRISARRAIVRVAAPLLGCVAIGMALVAALVYANWILFAGFCLVLVAALLFYRWVVPPEDNSSCQKHLRENEKTADLFAARTNPANVASFMYYMQWLQDKNKGLKSDTRLPWEVREIFTDTGEMVGNTTHPTFAERIAYLRPVCPAAIPSKRLQPRACSARRRRIRIA